MRGGVHFCPAGPSLLEWSPLGGSARQQVLECSDSSRGPSWMHSFGQDTLTPKVKCSQCAGFLWGLKGKLTCNTGRAQEMFTINVWACRTLRLRVHLQAGAKRGSVISYVGHGQLITSVSFTTRASLGCGAVGVRPGHQDRDDRKRACTGWECPVGGVQAAYLTHRISLNSLKSVRQALLFPFYSRVSGGLRK